MVTFVAVYISPTLSSVRVRVVRVFLTSIRLFYTD